jgi:glucose-6-phosphate isomerase
MLDLKIDTKFTRGFITDSDLDSELKNALKARELLHNKSGKGNDFLGWVDLPLQISDAFVSSIQETANKLSEDSEYLVVVGIGGSYLGARAVIESALSSLTPFIPSTKNAQKIIYAGHHIDADYHSELFSFLENKNFTVNIISKSGTTTEPALAFRSLLTLVEKKYGKEGAKKRIVATTDAKKGALKKLADEYGFKTFVIPDDVGGRYSVLTPVGLLPIACAGVDIKALVAGAKNAAETLTKESDPSKNLACKYAALRNALYKKGKKVEILVNYNPRLQYFTEWWKQLFGESEGKDKKGIFVTGVNFTSDLHSLGQYIQDGERFLFETILEVAKPAKDLIIHEFPGDPDGLNYLSGKTLSYLNSKAIEGTKLAHYEGGVPAISIEVPDLSMKTIGELIYFFEYACGVSGYMLGVNPFDQPGVEDYKNNMFALLGKKGYEAKKAEVEKKLKEI